MLLENFALLLENSHVVRVCLACFLSYNCNNLLEIVTIKILVEPQLRQLCIEDSLVCILLVQTYVPFR